MQRGIQVGWSKLALEFETVWGSFDHLLEGISEKIVLKRVTHNAFL